MVGMGLRVVLIRYITMGIVKPDNKSLFLRRLRKLITGELDISKMWIKLKPVSSDFWPIHMS
jgi:hypothetical protein